MRPVTSVWNRSPGDDDRVVARRAARGDHRALESLLTRHTDRIYAVCRRILVDHDDALDATQETLVAIARGIGSFNGRSAFGTWVHRVATNAALDELRRRKRRPVPTGDDLDRPARLVAIDDTVSDRLDVDAALAALPEDFRVAVVLRDLCDFEYAEIALILDVPAGTVRSRIARGRAALLDLLGNPTPVAERPIIDDERTTS